MTKGKQIQKLQREVESLRLSLRLVSYLIETSTNLDELRNKLLDAQIGAELGVDPNIIVTNVLLQNSSK